MKKSTLIRLVIVGIWVANTVIWGKDYISSGSGVSFAVTLFSWTMAIFRFSQLMEQFEDEET